MTHRDPHARAMAAPAVLARRIEIREATESDNAGLLALTRATPMGGTIALRIDRDPDFLPCSVCAGTMLCMSRCEAAT